MLEILVGDDTTKSMWFMENACDYNWLPLFLIFYIVYVPVTIIMARPNYKKNRILYSKMDFFKELQLAKKKYTRL